MKLRGAAAAYSGLCPTLAGDEHVLVRKLLHQLRRLAEIGREHVRRIARHPLRQVDRLIGPGVEADQDAGGPVADILDRVPITLRDITDVTPLQLLDPEAAVRAEQCDAYRAVDDVLPLV